MAGGRAGQGGDTGTRRLVVVVVVCVFVCVCVGGDCGHPPFVISCHVVANHDAMVVWERERLVPHGIDHLQHRTHMHVVQ
jgi:hypothetical protein